MIFTMRLATTSVVLSFCYVSTNSFTPITCTPISQSNTALHLVPSQGCQLAAASAAASVKEEDNPQHRDQKLLSNGSFPDQIDSSPPELSGQSITPTQAARVFVSRLFSIPSHIIPNGTSNSQQSWLQNPFEHNEACLDEVQDDVVLFPIVGFTFVKGENEEVQVLPSPNGAGGACNISSVRQTKEAPVYGWYSPACQLGDLHADDQVYCGGNDACEVEITDLQM